jgi:hypothetical protein
MVQCNRLHVGHRILRRPCALPEDCSRAGVLSVRGIICDTPEQVAGVIKADSFQATLVAVNTEKAHSCEVMEIAFIIHQARRSASTAVRGRPPRSSSSVR